ncbi:hypothetical protein GPECTOR_133g616 [Gonium pectorale]|uniref:cellulase n=1 Tax=Gonium pectorale TaxID=33097 RepID=A0A150FYC3_GONPE|nr:hypothetical protein GPECTOR_133g616 [Gonium pectorale]|eukprot:KXZ42577.1 hypothetical protein GPECTOR_133g616 [Gonium pectorale]
MMPIWSSRRGSAAGNCLYHMPLPPVVVLLVTGFLLAFHSIQASPVALDVLTLSLKFYEAQQSGSIASLNSFTWKNSSHLTDGYSSSGVTSDYYPGVDLSGGFYENGGHVKVSLTTAAVASLLALNGLAYGDNSGFSDQLSAIRRHVGWAAAYLDKCFYAPDKFVAQIGDLYTDDRYWGRPERQSSGGDEGSDSWRPVYTIDTAEGRGADVLSQAAAALASYATLLTKAGDASGDATHYRDRAMALWSVAKELEGVYVIPEGNITLLSRSYRDDQAWAAAWLCRYQIESGFSPTTEDYCASAESYWYEMTSLRGSQLYVTADTMHLAVAALLRDTMGRSDAYLILNETLLAEFNTALDAAFRWWTSAGDTACSCADVGLCKTPGGFMVLQEHGSAHFTTNMAMLALLTARTQPGLGAANQLSNADKFARRCWAHDQVSYLLGDNSGNGNAVKQAFVVGLGSVAGVDGSISTPKRPRHRASSCEQKSGKCYAASLDNVYELQGALVGGPKKDDSYTDSRNSFQSLVSIEYNAGFAGALAGLAEMESDMSAFGWSWDSACGDSGYHSTVLVSTGSSDSDDCSASACTDKSGSTAPCGLRRGSLSGSSLACDALYSADLDVRLALTDTGIQVTAPGYSNGAYISAGSGALSYSGLTLRSDGDLVWTLLYTSDLADAVSRTPSEWACAACSIQEYPSAKGTANGPFTLRLYLSATDAATLVVLNSKGELAVSIRVALGL